MNSKNLFARIEVGTLILAILFAPGTYILNVPGVDNYFGYRGVGAIDPLNYIYHDPIYITENNDFVLLGFPGSGTVNDPYKIDGYNITNSTGSLIEIRGTDVHFQISNNWIDGNNSASRGIYISNVENGVISNNTIVNSQGSGIYISASSKVIILGNTLYHHGTAGIELSTSTNNTIINNLSYDNGWDGIRLTISLNNTVTGNTAYGNSWKGIRLESHADNNLVQNNTVYNNNEDGIAVISSSNNRVIGNLAHNNEGGAGIALHTDALNNFIAYNTVYRGSSGIHVSWGSMYNDVFSNVVYDTTWGAIALLQVTNVLIRQNILYRTAGDGINLENASNNTIENNEIYENIRMGILAVSSSINNSFTGNVIYNNKEHGVNFGITSNNNRLERNDFQNNIFGFTQVADDAENNIIENNYYEDWSGSGAYVLDSSSGNIDPLPSINPHHISPIVIQTDENETSPKVVPISWTNATDIYHKITYSLFYSINEGTTWELIASDINTLNYSFDTSILPENSTVLYNIIATDDVGFISEFIEGVDYTEQSSPTEVLVDTSKESIVATTGENMSSDSENLSLNFNFLASFIGLFILVLIPFRKKLNQ